MNIQNTAFMSYKAQAKSEMKHLKQRKSSRRNIHMIIIIIYVMISHSGCFVNAHVKLKARNNWFFIEKMKK